MAAATHLIVSRAITRRKHLVTTITVTVLALLGLVLVCSYLSSGRVVTEAADAARCKNNLAVIQQAKLKWAEDCHKTAKDVPTWSDLVGTNHFLSARPECSRGGVYTPGSVGEPPKCSLPGHTL